MNKLLYKGAVFILFLTPIFIFGQSDLMLYNFRGVAQSSMLNPAIRTDQRFSLALFSNETSFHNTGFTLYDLMRRDTELDNNIQGILNKIDDKDFIRANNETHLLFGSFHWGKSASVSFGTKFSTLNSMTLPVNILWLTRGNDQERFRNQEVQLGGWTMDISMLMTWHVGMQYSINEKLSLGTRFNRHYGLVNLYLGGDANDTRVFFGDDEWRLNSNAFMRTSTILGAIDDPILEGATVGQLINDLDLSNNRGFSFDFGADYKFNEKFSVSTAVNGLGSILYNSGVRNIRVSGIVEFDGAEVDIRNNQFNTGDAVSSITDAFELDTIDGANYRRNLPTQIILAGEYRLSPRHAFASINRYTFWNERTFIDFNLRYIWTPTRFIHGLVNISTIQGKVFGGGAGVQLYFPGFQIFAMADIMSRSFDLGDFRGTSIHFGANIALWDKSKYKKTNQEKVKASES